MLGLLLLLFLGAPELPRQGLTFPPDNSILLTRESRVTLRWNLPGRKFRVELFRAGVVVRSEVVEGDRCQIEASPGEQYSWRVTPLQAVGARPHLGHFSVAQQFEYRATGRTGSPGKNGSNGGQVRVRLARDGAGMNLWIWERDRHLHYLCLDPQSRFLISVKGGDGGKGQDGIEFETLKKACGGPGGSAGWGGTVEIATRDAPWRDYVFVDVSPGEPGEGGQGGRYYWHGNIQKAPDGERGQSGRPGRVVTVIEP